MRVNVRHALENRKLALSFGGRGARLARASNRRSRRTERNLWGGGGRGHGRRLRLGHPRPHPRRLPERSRGRTSVGRLGRNVRTRVRAGGSERRARVEHAGQNRLRSEGSTVGAHHSVPHSWACPSASSPSGLPSSSRVATSRSTERSRGRWRKSGQQSQRSQLKPQALSSVDFSVTRIHFGMRLLRRERVTRVDEAARRTRAHDEHGDEHQRGKSVRRRKRRWGGGAGAPPIRTAPHRQT